MSESPFRLDFHHKLGPLPVGGWVLVAGGGLGLGLYIRRRRAAAAGLIKDPTGTGTTASDLSATGGDGSTAADGSTGLHGLLPAGSHGVGNLGGNVGNGGQTPPPPQDDRVRYVRFADADNPSAVYAVENGTAKWLSYSQWTDLGQPAPDLLNTLDSAYATVRDAKAVAPGGYSDVGVPVRGGRSAPGPNPYGVDPHQPDTAVTGLRDVGGFSIGPGQINPAPVDRLRPISTGTADQIGLR